MLEIELIDTSVFIFFVDIPQGVKHTARKQAAKDGLVARGKAGVQLILPIATVVETAQHIQRMGGGGQRRNCAVTFTKLVQDALKRTAPWSFIDTTWDASLVSDFLSQGGPVQPLSTSLGNGIHEAGDLLILTELRRLKAAYPAGLVNVGLWSFDAHLVATASSL